MEKKSYLCVMIKNSRYDYKLAISLLVSIAMACLVGCDKPSDNWESFFASLIDKCTPLKGPSTRYSQLQLPTENKELQRIFATDPELREYILKAEKYIVLVETDKKTKVQAILKKYGYII